MVFRPKPERQIAQVADRIVSQKEGLDALSWNRVTEIAHILQEGCDQETSIDLGSELSGIAHSNISLSYKLGIEGSVHTGQKMPSGMEMLEHLPPEEPFSYKKGTSSDCPVSHNLNTLYSEGDSAASGTETDAAAIELARILESAEKDREFARYYSLSMNDDEPSKVVSVPTAAVPVPEIDRAVVVPSPEPQPAEAP
ncbi:MAG: hypothetical protein RR862_02755, partial [Eggerthellaceae bacterium]